jgi:XTP/dITP diphosphohydrolase
LHIMKDFLIATKNKGKLEEYIEILSELPINIISYKDVGDELEIEETGETFEENAMLKAKTAFKEFKCPVIADDSGLAVDCLNGRPGVYSARYAGENSTSGEKNEKLLKELENVPDEKRTARFICAIAVVYDENTCFTVRGEVEGIIPDCPKGKNGFGYDPVFYIPELNKTMAQLSSKQKNRISHRGKALNKMLSRMRTIYENIGAE